MESENHQLRGRRTFFRSAQPTHLYVCVGVHTLPQRVDVKHRRLQLCQLYRCDAHRPDVTQFIVAAFQLHRCHLWRHPEDRRGSTLRRCVIMQTWYKWRVRLWVDCMHQIMFLQQHSKVQALALDLTSMVSRWRTSAETECLWSELRSQSRLHKVGDKHLITIHVTRVHTPRF